MNITDQIQSTSGVKRKRFTYSEQDKMKIVKYANECGLKRAVGKYKGEFPSLRESTVRDWLNKYRSQLEAKVQSSQIVISKKRDDHFIYLISWTKSFVHLSPICEWQVKLLTVT